MRLVGNLDRNESETEDSLTNSGNKEAVECDELLASSRGAVNELNHGDSLGMGEDGVSAVNDSDVAASSTMVSPTHPNMDDHNGVGYNLSKQHNNSFLLDRQHQHDIDPIHLADHGNFGLWRVLGFFPR